jgi:hypothetical protein
MTDLYPDEEGYISDGTVISFCKAAGTIALHSGVTLGTTAVSGAVSVVAGSADSDSVAVALKAANTNDYVPVCFFGIVKMVAGDTINEGDVVMNDASATYVLPIATLTHDEFTLWRGVVGATTGTGWRLGTAIQAGAASGDELLVLIGRIM